jgi:DNA helicase II / ATP-dependent DNA helicase PcrA
VHALGLAICTAALGRRPDVLGPADVALLLRHASDGRVGAAGGPPVDAVLSALTEVRLALRDPADVEESRGDVPGLAVLVPRYRRLLHARAALDFDEQVHLAVALLLADPTLRSRVIRTTTHLLVDEAQDLTPAFVLLVRLLVGPAQQLFAVGDDDQTIYGYAGATPRVLVDLPDATAVPRPTRSRVNHRCPPAVVRAATDLLAHNTVRVAKTVRSAHRPTPAPTRGEGARGIEADGPTSSVERIHELLATHRPHDVAVLARVSAALLAPQVALTASGVAVRRTSADEMLARTGMRTALAYLRCAVAPDRIAPADLADTLLRPARRIGGAIASGTSPSPSRSSHGASRASTRSTVTGAAPLRRGPRAARDPRA